MNSDNVDTSLRFVGDWPAVPVFLLALGLAALMFFYYRRELRFHSGPSRWVLPLLRSLAVFILVLCLAGPQFHHVSTFRQLGRVVVVADGSASMSFTDAAPSAPSAPAAGYPSSTVPGSAAPPSPGTAGSRFTRMEHALLNPATSIIRKLAEKHDVELFALRGFRPERLWWNRDGGDDTSGDLPAAFEFKPDSTSTNLDQPLRDALGPSATGTALVILTDGQHNGPGSPEDLAAGLRESGIPIFTVGYGSETPPPDLALLSVQAPEAVFAEDRAEGSLMIYDNLPPGLPATAVIAQAGKVLWQQPFTTDGSGERRIEFSFPVRDLSGEAGQSLRLLTTRVELTGAGAAQDKISVNNSRTLSLHLLTRKRSVLILDGRPRWETRYLHNHFDRDERWAVNIAFDDSTSGPSPAIQSIFPKKREDLMSYDLIVIGDLRPGALSPEQMGSINEFVEKRGGGLVLVDGQRGHLEDWRGTSSAALLPVSWTRGSAPQQAMTYQLTPEGQTLEALRLSDSSTTNTTLWKQLPKAMWAAPAQALPDATVVAQLSGAAPNQPALVWRRYGAGSVLWLATDEFWRWRYEVADQHHQRFWMQIAAWIAAPPFMVESDRLSLGTDRLRYREGDTAELRVRLRDASGTIVTDAKPRAQVYRNGLELASLELEPDPAHGGVFRAITGSLPSGDYQIRVSEKGLPSDNAKLAFRVESQANEEWSQLTLNRPLLEGMAQTSRGRFLREGDLSQLPDLLQQLDRKQTRTQDTDLWSSWWWFAAAMMLLTAEWLLRKRWRLL